MSTETTAAATTVTMLIGARNPILKACDPKFTMSLVSVLPFGPCGGSISVGPPSKVLMVPSDPIRWIKRVCRFLGRGFPQCQLEQYILGDQSLQSAGVSSISRLAMCSASASTIK